ncbi:phosphatidylserine/phosphatidylglycerophosphate/cardiolipin synthase family protein [Streptomyces sp. NPDC060065]|uniref:phospholipase D-like domain-containing protein n=1 Tax=Streptomyces sp. NPDC060065 TaxID=3347050 RepID=UPI0036BE9572
MALVMTSLTAPPANAGTPEIPGTCDESGNYEVCFTYAGDGDPDYLITQRIKGKIDATASSPGADDYIRVAMYEWGTSGYGDDIAESLIEAAKNGVSVRVVLGDATPQSVADRFKDKGIDAVRCANACTGESGAMHNKFFLIKHNTSKLVLQTSTNLTETQAEHAQNLLVSRDDPKLFSHYVNYWRRLYDKDWTWGGDYWSETERARYGTNDLSRAYFYPMPTKSPLVGVLRKVTACSEGNDRVWLEASLFDSSTFSEELAVELKRLLGIGCNVKVILQKDSGYRQLTYLPTSGGYFFPNTRVKCDGQSHNKLLLIDATYAGALRKAVFVGSYNITENSLRASNDATLRIINGWVTNRYIDQFEKMWANPRACDAD